MAELRVIDVGRVNPLRSQCLWHGIASAIEPERQASSSRPEPTATLSFCQPDKPYVSIGFHRDIQELDRVACRRSGLPILRRRIGGGPVFLDSDQLFFQITIPARRAPMPVRRLYQELLGPAVKAFRQLGVDAKLSGLNDIAVCDRRLSGTGAGQIGGGVTVVGNVIFRFPHERMIEILAWPSRQMRDECGRLMRRHVSSLDREGIGHVTLDQAKAALRTAYATALGGKTRDAELEPEEENEIRRWEQLLMDHDWLKGPSPKKNTGRRIKICAGVWVFAASGNDLEVQVSIVNGCFADARIVRAGSKPLNGAKTSPQEMRRVLLGSRAETESIQRGLLPFGEDGRRVWELLEPGLVSP